MGLAGAVEVERRRLLGTDLEVSRLGLALDPEPGGPPAHHRRLVDQLREARAHGVTLFDVAEARAPARAERLLADAFPGPDPGVLVQIGWKDHVRSPGPPAGPPARGTRMLADVESELRDSIRASQARLGPRFPVLVELTVHPGSDTAPSGSLAAVEALVAHGEAVAWSLRVPPEGALPTASLGGVEVRRLAAEVSLLDSERVASLDDRARHLPTALTVRDPYARGRLDGTRIAPGLSHRGPAQPPVGVRTLAEELAPVLRLGFLTAGQRRTLAQAAVQYWLAKAWVETVLVPLPPAERWAELLSIPGLPPLTSEEVARIEQSTVGGTRGSSAPSE